jgi:hypothetical protein
MPYYSLAEIMKVLDRAEADYIARLKQSTAHDEKKFCVSAVYATREIKKLFKKDWVDKGGGS